MFCRIKFHLALPKPKHIPTTVTIAINNMVPATSSVPSANSCPTSLDLPQPSASNGAIVINDNQPKLPTKKGNRAGALNYSNDDISAMLDIVEEEEPLGANHWAVVASKFAKWAKENDRPHRDQDSLKNKFDKLSNMKKKTGDPSCPQPVRRAKHIARAIHNKCAAMTLGGSSDVEDNAVVVANSSEGSEISPRSDRVGEPRKKRKTAATGTVSKARTEQVLVDYLGAMSEHVGAISDCTVQRSSDGLTRNDVVSIVKDEVKESMKPTEELLSKMNSMLERLTSFQRKDV